MQSIEIKMSLAQLGDQGAGALWNLSDGPHKVTITKVFENNWQTAEEKAAKKAGSIVAVATTSGVSKLGSITRVATEKWLAKFTKVSRGKLSLLIGEPFYIKVEKGSIKTVDLTAAAVK